ncbi:hypothetical protein HBI12_119190 [Parastagonospora nodorum]|nr:hypothetical protein HBI12_119190 [Parastagonospora nodorum]
MARASLEKLPMEVLQSITNILDASHRRSVASFSLVNRRCRLAATCALFRTLSIRIENLESLAAAIEQWTATLQPSDSFRHVRTLKVRGDVYADWESHSRDQAPDKEVAVTPPFKYEDAWLPLVRFMEVLPSLKDMHFQCHGSLPSALLPVLSYKHRSCRLHLSNFSLDSLRVRLPKGCTSLIEPSAHDLAIVSLPNLRTIATDTVWDNIAPTDYTPNALAEMLAHYCPWVEDIDIISRRSESEPSAFDYVHFPGLKHAQEAKGKVNLSSLSVGGGWSELNSWDTHANLPALHTLRLKNADAGLLGYETSYGNYSSLKVLELGNCQGGGLDYLGNVVNIIPEFLESLVPLEEIAITGEIRKETLDAVMVHHGASLRRLALPAASLSVSQLSELNAKISGLEHLHITLRRTGGDADEVALYDTLATFPHLQSLIVELDCSIDITGDLGDTNSFSYDDGFMRQTLVNRAIDATLAASIFRRMASGSAPLRSVELEVKNVAEFNMLSDGASNAQEIGNPITHFTRKWMCGWDVRDDRQGEVAAEECDESKRGRLLDEEKNEVRRLGAAEGAFRQLWPETSGDWRDDWKSFPLQE